MDHDHELLREEIVHANRTELRGPIPEFRGKKHAEQAPGTAAAYEVVFSVFVRFGVCNRRAKNATIGIDRGTADWVRNDARLAAPNTYGSFWDAANRGNRLVHARRTVVIANGAARQQRLGRNGSAGCSASDSRTATIRNA